MAPSIGKYVVAIEIKEYRNGILIGITRRDLQLLIINCSPNPSPNLSAVGGSGKTDYTITEGETLCFPITFVDPNGDNLSVVSSGTLFDNSKVNPSATINTPINTGSSATANFCWSTVCGQAQALPYRFNVSAKDDGCPEKTTNVVYSIQVNPPTSVSSISGPVNVCLNHSATYVATSIPGAIYHWSVTSGTITSGGTSSTIDVDWTSLGSGIVTVMAESSFGCPSTPFSLNTTIIDSPTADAGNNDTICLNDTSHIGGNPTGPIGATYTWAPASGLSATNIANPLAFPNTTTTYTVTVNLAGTSCTGIDSVKITVGSAGNYNAGNDVALCSGDTTQLSASGGNFYTWLPTSGLSNTNIANPLAHPASTTTYTVTISDTLGCSGTDNVKVTVNPIPVANAGNDTTLCANISHIIGGTPSGTPGATYSWSPGASLNDSTLANPIATPSITTTYTLTVKVNNCSSIDSVKISVNSKPIANAGTDTLICLGNNVQLNASGGLSYNWLPTTGLSNPTIPNPIANPSITTTYTLTVTSNGCSDIDSLTINVFRIKVSNDTALCMGDSIQLFASGINAVTYSWLPISDLSDPNIQNPWASPTGTVTYTVTGTDTHQCTDNDQIKITVNTFPTATFKVKYSLSCGGLLAEFTNESINATSYMWNFGDGTTSTETNPSHLYSFNTTFNISLVALNNGTCSDTAIIQNSTNSFQDYFSINVPNVFTPNNDGMNDRLSLNMNVDLSDCFSITIFDRWGLKLFSSNYPKLEWDGRTTAGKKVVSGTYFYIIDINGIQFKGQITLIE